MAARRPGLVAKKIATRGKQNKSVLRTYWVLPDYKQAQRLHRLKQQARAGELPTTDSKTALGAWCKAKGFDIGPGGPAVLQAFFKQPGKPPLVAEDFEAMFGDPGPHKILVQDYVRDSDGKPIRDDNTRQDKVAPVLTEGGAQQYRTIPFATQIEKITIDADRVMVQAKIMDPGPPATVAGSMFRVFSKGAENTLTVEHEYLAIDARYSGGGLGTTLLQKQLGAYPGLGVTEVKVGATWVGRYTWASMGFQMEAPAQRALTRQFARYIETIQTGETPLLKGPDEPYTERELKSVYDWKGLSYKAAAAEIPVYNPTTGRTDMRKLGKEFLLDENTDGWNGGIPLDNGASHARVEEYLKLDSMAGVLRRREAANEAGQLGMGEQKQALLQAAADMEERVRTREGAAMLRASIYAAKDQERLQRDELALRGRLQGLTIKAPGAGAGEAINQRGLSDRDEERFLEARVGAKRATDPLLRQALAQDVKLLEAEGRVALLERRLAEGAPDGVRANLEFDLAVAKAARDGVRGEWLTLQEAVEAKGLSRDWQAEPEPKETLAAQDKARIARNLAAAERDVTEANIQLAGLGAGATPEAIERLRQQQYNANMTLGRMRVLAEGEAFDEQEAAELRAKQEGIEAARYIGKGIQALARVRNQVAREQDMLTPRGNYQTRTDREVLVLNKRRLDRMAQLAEAEVAAAQTMGPEALQKAKKRLMVVKNMLAMANISLTKVPESAEDAARSRQRQLTLERGEGFPESIRDLMKRARAEG